MYSQRYSPKKSKIARFIDSTIWVKIKYLNKITRYNNYNFQTLNNNATQKDERLQGVTNLKRSNIPSIRLFLLFTTLILCIINIVNEHFFPFLLFGICFFLLTPFDKRRISNSIDTNKNWITVVCFILGIIITSYNAIDANNQNIGVNTKINTKIEGSGASKGWRVDNDGNIEKADANYIDQVKKQPGDNSTFTMIMLAKISAVLKSNNEIITHPDERFLSKQDDINNNPILVYDPKLNFTITDDFTIENPKYGKLLEYYLIYNLDKDKKINGRCVAIKYSNAGVVQYSIDSAPDINTLVSLKRADELIAIKTSERSEKAPSKVSSQTKKHFEDNCLSAWDGSCTELEIITKRRLNDPGSYEHVETRYIVHEEYAEVVMTYRAKNALGALVINKIAAIINVKDCSVMKSQ